MPKRQLPSRVRYDLANPVIAVRVPKDDYDKLDYLRQTEGVSFAELLLRALNEKEDLIELGECSKCGHGYKWSLDNEAQMTFLDQAISKAKPMCKKCKEVGAVTT